MSADIEVMKLKATVCADQIMARTPIDFRERTALVRLMIAGAYLDGMAAGLLSMAPAVADR